MYNLRARGIRQELLEEDFAVESECEEQTSSESEQDCSDGSDIDYVDTNISDDDMEDGVDERRANRSRSIGMEIEDIPLATRLPSVRGRPKTKLYGKHGFAWETRQSVRQSNRFEIDENYEAELIEGAEILSEIEEFWNLLFTEEIVNIIVEKTNDKIELECAKFVAENNNQSYHNHTDPIEIKAFIGVLYFAGLWKSCHVDIHELWDKASGLNFYRSAFSRLRFTFLLSCLRFDDQQDRDPDDRFSPIRKIWDIFINNCRRYYKPSSECTVDEQLLSFRGRCIFRMYIKSKPDKYGLKLITLNDASTAYLIWAIPYLGKSAKLANLEKLPASEFFFTEVTKPIHGSSRSVTCDNWFTSVPLVTRMLKHPYKLYLTGTLKKNKTEVPLEMKIAAKKAPGTKFCHTSDLQLLSYTPKKRKIVLLLSSYKKTQEITNGKPNTVLFYNSTKGGTDTFDQLCHAYTVSRKTNRWPQRVFYGILDQSIVNSRIMWKLSKGPGTNSQTSSVIGMKKIIHHLVSPHMRRRLENDSVRMDLKLSIRAILKIDVPDDVPDDFQKTVFQVGQRCSKCPRKNDRKTRNGCSSCQRPICEQHRHVLCFDCIGQ